MEELEERVKKGLDEIRSFLQKDGGDITFLGIEGNVLKVRLEGNCTYCGINRMTLQNGVESIVRKHAPEIEKVENVIE